MTRSLNPWGPALAVLSLQLVSVEARAQLPPEGIPEQDTTASDTTGQDASEQDPKSPSAELSADEADLLAALDSQSSEEADMLDVAEPRGLDIYGFIDFSFSKYFLDDNSLWRASVYDKSAFSVGNLNVYLDAEIAKNWRSLAEVRFTYLPNGNRRVVGLDVERTDTSATDYTAFGIQERVGGVVIERAWLDYTAHSLLNIRAGNWLTPYSVWNVDHGSPTIIPVVVPFSLGLKHIPERQSGLLLHGTTPVSSAGLLGGYHLGLSNGRGPLDDFADLDENKAVTARLYGEYFGLGELRIGATMYLGDVTELEQEIGTTNGTLGVFDRISRQLTELAYAVDTRWVYQGFHLQWELVTIERVFSEAGRPQHNERSFAPNHRLFATYGLVGYRTKWLNTMPYIGAETFTIRNDVEPQRPPDNDRILTMTAGLNSRPTPPVTLKLQYMRGEFLDPPENSVLQDPVDIVSAQAAWAF